MVSRVSASIATPRVCSEQELDTLREQLAALTERVSALDRLMEAKFVTFGVLVESQAEKVALALSAADKAVSKAEIATEKRFESVNEFRATLADQATNLTSKAEFVSKIESITSKLTELTDRINISAGKGQGIGAVWGWVVGTAGIVSAVVVALVAFIK